MFELSEAELDMVCGGSTVGDGMTCVVGSSIAVAGILTSPTGIGVAMAWGGLAISTVACYDFGMAMGWAGTPEFSRNAYVQAK